MDRARDNHTRAGSTALTTSDSSEKHNSTMSSPNSGGRAGRTNLLSNFQNMNLSRQPLLAIETSPHKDTMSLAECYEELGRLRQKIEDKDAKINEIDRDKAALSIANEDAHEELVQHRVFLRKAEHEIKRLTQENEYLEKEREHLEITVKQLKEQLGKAQKTIKVQSDQIGMRMRPSPEHSTPGGGLVQSFQPVHNQPPPRYNPQSSFSAFQHQLTTTTPPPALSRQPSSTFHNAPRAMSREASSASFNQPYPSNDMRTIMPPPMPHDPSRDGQIILKPMQNNLYEELKDEFKPVFDEVETWARKYTNMPDKEKDSSLPSKLLSHIRSNTNSDLAAKLLASSSTRCLAVARVMNHTIVNNAFKPALIKGFGQTFDKQYADLRLQLQQVALPLPVRRAALVASAKLVDEMTRTKGFNTFIEGSIQGQVHRMWTLLEPLFAEGMKRNDAWKELGFIWHKAAHVGLKILKKASNFNFDFPPVGVNSHWNQSSMVNRGPNFDQRNYQVDSAPASVRLAISPTVTETNFVPDKATDKIIPTTLYKAHVLLDF